MTSCKKDIYGHSWVMEEGKNKMALEFLGNSALWSAEVGSRQRYSSKYKSNLDKDKAFSGYFGAPDQRKYNKQLGRETVQGETVSEGE